MNVQGVRKLIHGAYHEIQEESKSKSPSSFLV